MDIHDICACACEDCLLWLGVENRTISFAILCVVSFSCFPGILKSIHKHHWYA
jgi:hypothetical protein